MQNFNITGMSCAACSTRIENAVSKLEGVQSCSVSLLTNSLAVTGNASPQKIIKAVQNAGYGASPALDKKDFISDKEIPRLKKRLSASLLFLFSLLYFSMGHRMFFLPLPAFFERNEFAQGIAQFFLCLTVLVINRDFFTGGFRALIHFAPDMDSLVALGSTAAFLYSSAMLFAENFADLYFEGAAMIPTLITVGKILETHSKGKTTNALKALINLSPKTACVIRSGKEIIIPAEEIVCGDIFCVRPGENIPADGIIIEGSTSINEAAITGESLPAEKQEGDSVTDATLNHCGFIKCRATRVGKDTTLSRIIKLVSDAASTKAPVQKTADRISAVFVPSVIIIAAVTVCLWLLAGEDFGFALSRGISVLVISCPCALGLATPVAVMVADGVGAKNGILFKTAASLEQAGRTQIAVLDKTGTLTKGQGQVTDIIPAQGISELELLEGALALEAKSSHPLAKAVVQKAYDLKLSARPVSDFMSYPGNGLCAKDASSTLTGGSVNFLKTKIPLTEEILSKADALSSQGKTPLLFARDRTLLGIIAVSDVIKDDSRQAVENLKLMGIIPVMLTGDNERTARTIAEQAGIGTVISGAAPDKKAEAVSALKKLGRVTMVGDGINDAVALTAADTGIAVGAGTDIAADAAGIVLMKNSLNDICAAINLSRAALFNIKQNLFWAFIYNVLGIPIAAGAFIRLWGWSLNPMFCAAAMSLSSFCVVTNALRLNFVNLKRCKKAFRKNTALENAVKNILLTEKTMKKTLKIEGMMCSKCEAHVVKALEAVPGVSGATASCETAAAVVELNGDVSDEALKAAVEAQEYKVLGIE